MQATRLKHDKEKRRCDRCQQAMPNIHECSFAFKHPFAYWRDLYQRTTGLRLTLRRHRALHEILGFEWKRAPVFWMDLCEGCWDECQQPYDGFPMTFWEAVVLRIAPTAKKSVPSRSR